mmetsp:Transcript_25823/g.36061  ORF Transcript_25823/g.36061 Transcript_25823/m.36061 type:complete len:250 (-) Transcript_25823:22-771(-)
MKLDVIQSVYSSVMELYVLVRKLESSLISSGKLDFEQPPQTFIALSANLGHRFYCSQLPHFVVENLDLAAWAWLVGERGFSSLLPSTRFPPLPPVAVIVLFVLFRSLSKDGFPLSLHFHQLPSIATHLQSLPSHPEGGERQGRSYCGLLYLSDEHLCKPKRVSIDKVERFRVITVFLSELFLAAIQTANDVHLRFASRISWGDGLLQGLLLGVRKRHLLLHVVDFLFAFPSRLNLAGTTLEHRIEWECR